MNRQETTAESRAMGEEIDRLFDQLASDSVDERRRAEDALVAFGARAIGPLLERLHTSKGGEISWYIARALSRIGTPAIEPILAFIRGSAGDEAKRFAAAAVAEMRDPPVRRLIDMLGDPDPCVRRYASLALCRIGVPAAGMLMKALEGSDGMHRRCIQMTLLRLHAGLHEITGESHPE